MLSRHLLSLAVLALALGACVSSTPPPPIAETVILPPVTPLPSAIPEPVDEATVQLVADYWEARDAAWDAGVGAGIAFSLANNHPLLSYTPEECREAWFNGDPNAGFAERNTFFPETVVSDPTFMMAVGPLAGRDLGEGLLEMQVLYSYERIGTPVADRKTTVHLQVADGRVRHFLLCEPLQITVVEQEAAAPGAATTGGTTTVNGATPGTGSLGEPVTVLPPVTVVPAPVSPPGDGSGTGTNGDGTGDGGGDGTGSGSGGGSAPGAPGGRPSGSGIDFCDTPPSGSQPAAGDYYLCPDDDVDRTATEEPAATPTSQASEDVTRG